MAGSLGGPQKLTGMQKQVLALYRAFLRAARSKAPEERRTIESIVSAEFHNNARTVDRKNFLYIEYLLRRGSKQLDQLRHPDTVRLSTLKLLEKTGIPSILHGCARIIYPYDFVRGLLLI